MSVMPWPDHLLSLEDWAELPEDTTHRYELVDGILHVSPRPLGVHQWVSAELRSQLKFQLPRTLVPLEDLEVVVVAGPPATVRAPDILVVPVQAAAARPPRHPASDVVLAVEVISPGSRMTDLGAKMFEYADAGIPNYWLVDTDDPLTLTAYHLIDGDYRVVGSSTTKMSLSEPAPVTIDVAELVPYW